MGASNAFNAVAVISKEIPDNNPSMSLPNSCDNICNDGESLLSPTGSNGMNEIQNIPMREIGDRLIDKQIIGSFEDSAIRQHNQTSNTSTQTPSHTNLQPINPNKTT